ncbi:MAG: hypothetical protein LBU88_00335 [Treponema sp.]|jgi:hypothetical protein|nr:hypothetical protein [Treponema sp.]
MWWMLIGAGIGAGLGAISTYEREQQEKAVLQHQKEQAWAAYVYGKSHSDQQYAISKQEAHYQLGEQDRALHEGMGLFNDQFNTGLLAQAFAEQDARIQTSSATGMSLAAEGASGTRGNESNEMVRAYAKQGLEQQVGTQKQQNEQILKGTIQDANRSVKAINYERDSWDPGGYRYKMKQSQDTYNLNIANLGQADFNKRMEWATATPLDYVTSAFGGASSGINFGYSMWDMNRNYNGNPEPWKTIGG